MYMKMNSSALEVQTEDGSAETGNSGTTSGIITSGYSVTSVQTSGRFYAGAKKPALKPMQRNIALAMGNRKC